VVAENRERAKPRLAGNIAKHGGGLVDVSWRLGYVVAAEEQQVGFSG
jgi:hypothetical protein